MNFGIIAKHSKFKDLNGETPIGSVTYENKTGSMSGTSPLGDLHSGDTKFGPGKMPT